MCSEVWKSREKCYRIFKTTGNIEDKIKWNRARAKATRTFREEKKKEWQSYVDALSINTKASSVWRKIKSVLWKASFNNQHAERKMKLSLHQLRK